MTTTTAPVDWDSPLWGTGVVHIAAWCADEHDASEARATA